MFKPTAVLTLAGYKVYTEYHRHSDSAKTIVLVNGALATTGSFGQSLRYLAPHFNVVLFDLPYAGQSKAHNPHLGIVDKDDEVRLLQAVIAHFEANYLLSMSWGGVSSLMALAQRPSRIEKAVIASFSPVLNSAMREYVTSAQRHLQARDKRQIGALLNTTVGQYLPRLLKLFNYKHLISLAEQEYAQIEFHIRQVLELDASNYAESFSAIDIPVLFINGAKDDYTTAEQARGFAAYIPNSHFRVIPDAGHFLDMESKDAWNISSRSVPEFLGAGLAQGHLDPLRGARALVKAAVA